jgi:hypothetical protein
VNGDWPASDQARSAAQLEVTLRVLDEIGELRREVDTLRASVPSGGLHSVPGVVLRVAAEAGVLVAAAVVCGAGHFRAVLTVALMAAALVAVTVSEWLASRSEYVPRSFGFAQARPVLIDPLPEEPLESDRWERGYTAEPEPARP